MVLHVDAINQCNTTIHDIHPVLFYCFIWCQASPICIYLPSSCTLSRSLYTVTLFILFVAVIIWYHCISQKALLLLLMVDHHMMLSGLIRSCHVCTALCSRCQSGVSMDTPWSFIAPCRSTNQWLDVHKYIMSPIVCSALFCICCWCCWCSEMFCW